jgi:hypothetical protein
VEFREHQKSRANYQPVFVPLDVVHDYGKDPSIWLVFSWRMKGDAAIFGKGQLLC